MSMRVADCHALGKETRCASMCTLVEQPQTAPDQPQDLPRVSVTPRLHNAVMRVDKRRIHDLRPWLPRCTAAQSTPGNSSSSRRSATEHASAAPLLLPLPAQALDLQACSWVRGSPAKSCSHSKSIFSQRMRQAAAD